MNYADIEGFGESTGELHLPLELRRQRRELIACSLAPYSPWPSIGSGFRFLGREARACSVSIGQVSSKSTGWSWNARAEGWMRRGGMGDGGHNLDSSAVRRGAVPDGPAACALRASSCLLASFRRFQLRAS